MSNAYDLATKLGRLGPGRIITTNLANSIYGAAEELCRLAVIEEAAIRLVNCEDPHLLSLKIKTLAGTLHTIKKSDAETLVKSEDRKMLEYLMQQFNSEECNCERCGWSEGTSECDSADILRRYLAGDKALMIG